MTWHFEHPILTSKLGAGVVVAYGLFTFMWGVNYAKLQSTTPSIDTGGIVIGVLASTVPIGVFEYVIRKEGISKAKECLRPYHNQIHKLKSLAYKFSDEGLREECMDIVNDLEQTLKESIAEVNAAKEISKWLRNQSHLENLRNQGVAIAQARFDIVEGKALTSFARDIYDYLILVKDTLPSFGPWEFDPQRLLSAYQDGSLPTIEPYITAVNAVTRQLEEMFNATGAAETLADDFLDYLRQIDSEKRLLNGGSLQV